MMRYLFVIVWIVIVGFLISVSYTFRSKEEAMVAVVESQVTAVTFQRPVVIQSIYVVPGQEVNQGDTLIRVGRPDLTLDLDKKENELQRLLAQIEDEKSAFSGKKALLLMERDSKTSRLQLDREELVDKLARQKRVTNTLGSNEVAFYDTLTQKQIGSIEKQMVAVSNFTRAELRRLEVRLKEDLQVLDSEIALIQKELQVLEEEFNLLSKVSTLNGIIGTVNVQLDELVQPYRTILSIYERRPTLIKAYMNEKITYPIAAGDQVEVVSENRLYKVQGTVKELGARVVGYPNKLQPANLPRSYGQEVFIEISEDNRFLNGEKVFVYPIVLE